MKTKPAPAPCVVVKYENGQPVKTETVVRDPLPLSDERENERGVSRFVWRVMATQETGEECFVGRYSTRAQADRAITMHMASHPEHRSCWKEKI